MEKESISDSNSEQTNHIDEKGLWALIKSGNKSGLSALYNLHVKQLYKYGYFLVPDSDNVEDAIHDIFVRIWSNRNNQIEITSLKSYLFVSLRREVIARKKELAHLSYRIDNIKESLISQPSIEEKLIDAEISKNTIKLVQLSINNQLSSNKQ